VATGQSPCTEHFFAILVGDDVVGPGGQGRSGCEERPADLLHRVQLDRADEDTKFLEDDRFPFRYYTGSGNIVRGQSSVMIPVSTFFPRFVLGG
jgi:hypothetical protein